MSSKEGGVNNLRFIALVVVPALALVLSLLAVLALPVWAAIGVALGALTISVGSVQSGRSNA